MKLKDAEKIYFGLKVQESKRLASSLSHGLLLLQYPSQTIDAADNRRSLAITRKSRLEFEHSRSYVRYNATFLGLTAHAF